MIREIITCLKTNNYKGLIRCVKSVMPKHVVNNIVFFHHYHRFIRYNSPEFLDEKLLILSEGAYKNNKLIIQCSDKYAVRQYVQDKGLGHILNELIGAYDSVNEIHWKELPSSFAIKCNHGCGYNIIIRNKQEIDKQDVFCKLEAWMKEDYSILSAESHYHTIPHKIIIEKFIETKNGDLPIDYKFFSSRGKVICALIFTGRDDKPERIYVDEKFEDLELINEYTGSNYKNLKPRSFEEMVKIAQILSADFPFVRVDLYDQNGKVLFGELTFTPHGCIHDYLDKNAQQWIGSRISL